MGLRERLLETLGGLFPKETATFDEFLELGRQISADSIEAHMKRRMCGGTNSAVVGNIGDFEYFIEYISKGKGKGVFKERYVNGIASGNEHSVADFETPDSMWTLLAVTALNRFSRVRGSMPDVQTTLFFKDKEVSQEKLQKLSRAQEKQHLRPLIVKR